MVLPWCCHKKRCIWKWLSFKNITEKICFQFHLIYQFCVLMYIYIYHISMVCSMFQTTELRVSSQLRNYILKISEGLLVANKTHKPKIKAINSNYINILLVRIVHIFSHWSTLYPFCGDQHLQKVEISLALTSCVHANIFELHFLSDKFQLLYCDDEFALITL